MSAALLFDEQIVNFHRPVDQACRYDIFLRVERDA
jgi:hypothetical protein